MENERIELVGEKRSAVCSSFSVFETYVGWKKWRESKVIPDGKYFAVLTTTHKVELKPDLFVQGYRPHSSSGALSVERRRYGEFVRYGLQGQREEFNDDVVFLQANLYQVESGNKVELILEDGDSYSEEKMSDLVDRICWEQGLERLGDLHVCKYSCSLSEGYFLAGREYKVWAVLVGKNVELSLKKKVLVFDYETGIPALVEYEADAFVKL